MFSRKTESKDGVSFSASDYSHIIWSIFDSKVGVYGPPSLARNVPEASRFVARIAGQSDLIKAAPADFVVFQVGVWDDTVGQISALPSPSHLFSVADCLPPAPTTEQTVADLRSAFSTQAKMESEAR